MKEENEMKEEKDDIKMEEEKVEKDKIKMEEQNKTEKE